MKITDVKVTVWEWNNIPPTRYTLNVKALAPVHDSYGSGKNHHR